MSRMKKIVASVCVVAAASPAMADTNLDNVVSGLTTTWQAAAALGVAILVFVLGIKVIRRALGR